MQLIHVHVFVSQSSHINDYNLLILINKYSNNVPYSRITSTELVSLYIGYWTLNNYYYYNTHKVVLIVVTCLTCLYLEPNVMMKKKRKYFVGCAF